MSNIYWQSQKSETITFFPDIGSFFVTGDSGYFLVIDLFLCPMSTYYYNLALHAQFYELLIDKL